MIQGLADGRVAVMTKIHHAVIDGISGAEIMGVQPEPAAPPEADDSQLPSTG